MHQLHNLISTNVTTRVVENAISNPNSILYLMNKLVAKSIEEGSLDGTFRIVSPYIFVGMYKNEEGKIIYDVADFVLKILKDNRECENCYYYQLCTDE